MWRVDDADGGAGSNGRSGPAYRFLYGGSGHYALYDVGNWTGSRSTIASGTAVCILTPHPKEFDRLAGASNSAYERLQKAREFAKEHRLCVVLKDAYTAICTSEGNVYYSVCGNPGMATAGSGDVLTGIILGLLAQGYEPETAAVAGVFLHGTAGDLAAAQWSERGMISGDLIDSLGKAFKQVI